MDLNELKKAENLARQVIQKGINETNIFFDELVSENKMTNSQRVRISNEIDTIEIITKRFIIDEDKINREKIIVN